MRRKPKVRASRKQRAVRCADVGCNGADCLDCNPLLISLVVATVAGYRATPRPTDGSTTTRPLLRMIRSYQANVSAHRPAVCNLTPTCSHHAYDVLRRRGPAGLLEVRRRLRACAAAGRAARSSRA